MMSRVVLLCVVLFFTITAVADKVHNNIHKYYTTHADSEVISSILLLKDAVDIKRAVANVPFEARGQVVFDVLTKKAAATQPTLISSLNELNIKHTAYWLVNMVVIEANYSTLLSLSSHNSIGNIHPNFEFKVPLEQPETLPQNKAPNAIEWNVVKVKAPDVWSLGFRGTGYTVAGADTGVQWDHPALKTQYRGYVDDTTVQHDFNWWDAIHATGSRCGANSRLPCDDSGHGTHTVGTMVGDDHNTRQIGVAPDAKWIACRNMNAGYGTPVTYIECLQFFVAPTDLDGRNPDPTLRPHVIGNSYGCPPSEGCVPDSLSKAVTAVVSAGIFFSVSAGNSGPSCATVDAPPGTYEDSFSVGALGYNTNTIASYSSRGPVGTILKPEISAPGSTVTSAYPTNSYTSMSGTSMASPHITGLIALLWQAKPALARDIDASAKVLQASALRLPSTTCGGNTTQNNVYGSGGVDILAAVKTLW